VRYLYTLLFYLIVPFILLRLLWRSRKSADYRKRWSERFGFAPKKLEKSIWVHAVSLGETIAATPLIKTLRATYPDYPIVVTNMTLTGSARAKLAFGDSVIHSYVPYDLPDAVSRFIDRIQPKIFIAIETELWPNLFSACKQKNIPIVLANARLSEKSARGYQSVAPLTKKMLSEISLLASQGTADAERFIKLGMPKEKIIITGNIKFDLELPKDLEEKSKTLREELGKEKHIWIAGSTHPGEEEIILAAHAEIRKKFPTALLILVPRHPERFDDVEKLCKEKNFSVVRRSRGEKCDDATAIYLSDTMGEMMLMYSVCDVAFVGGSFVSVGGHNMLEPAAVSKPVLTGPHLFNFAEISELLFSAGGMFKVTSANELAEKINTFFENKNMREEIGNRAYHVVKENSGALRKQLEGIKKFIS